MDKTRRGVRWSVTVEHDMGCLRSGSFLRPSIRVKMRGIGAKMITRLDSMIQQKQKGGGMPSNTEVKQKVT